MLLIILLAACGKTQKKQALSQSIDSVYLAGKISTDSFKHTFYIKSTGTADLTLDTVVSSCDCMTVDWTKKPVKPGDTAFINVVVKPNRASTGEASKTFMVRTNTQKKFSIFNILYTL